MEKIIKNAENYDTTDGTYIQMNFKREDVEILLPNIKGTAMFGKDIKDAIRHKLKLPPMRQRSGWFQQLKQQHGFSKDASYNQVLRELHKQWNIKRTKQ